MGVAARHAYRTQFLRSDFWQNLRLEVLVRDEGKCKVCRAEYETPKLDAHHTRYPRKFTDSALGHLITVCRRCHELLHEKTTPGKYKDGSIAWKEFRRAAIEIRAQADVAKCEPKPKPPASSMKHVDRFSRDVREKLSMKNKFSRYLHMFLSGKQPQCNPLSWEGVKNFVASQEGYCL